MAGQIDRLIVIRIDLRCQHACSILTRNQLRTVGRLMIDNYDFGAGKQHFERAPQPQGIV